MQTRKRAKSVSFGKKEKKEKEEIKEIPERKVEVEEVKKISEKAEVVERRSVPDKPQSDELSTTLPDATDTEEDTPTSEVETPASEFVIDSSSSEAASELSTPKGESVEVPKEEELTPTATPTPVSTELSQPVETPPQAVVSSETPPPVSGSQELSSTLPPSAFTIQNGDSEPQSISPEGGRKRFGIYFFVVAFLAFILGLGAMAAASYFGVINLQLPKVPFSTSIHMPAFLGAKPTPTSAPKPTAVPTAKPVDLSQYSIAVLNGSGVTGEAGKVKTTLTTDKFNVTSTGNADNNNYTKTIIAAKKTVDTAYLTQLESELKKSFDVDSTVSSLTSGATDVTVTLGSSTAQ
jgi:LytR cell envelope-related transcriptional attenuator